MKTKEEKEKEGEKLRKSPKSGLSLLGALGLRWKKRGKLVCVIAMRFLGQNFVPSPRDEIVVNVKVGAGNFSCSC